MADDLAPRLQRSLGDTFTLENELGGGGMSRVFLAQERALGRRVVVKVLDLEGAVAASAERFRREVQVIAKLQHPHIVPVLTAGGDETLLWYVMPYVSGESLRARLVREGALPLADAARIARELFDALGFAHDHGIVHRDVKPENILLEGRHAVVADFGVAKALADAGVSGQLTTAGLALGTPAYMAPEQAMADATTNHRADLYAAGAVLYEMLAGAPPFSGNAQSVIAAHMSSAVPRVEERRGDVPPALAQLIQRLMAKNPAERPQSAHEALTQLESLTTPAGTVLSKPVAAGARWRRYRPLIPLAVAAVVAAAWWEWRRPTSRVVDGTDVIAIMPFGSTGDSSLAKLGRELVVTLGTSLDGVGSLRAIDAMTVLQAAKDLPQPLRLDDARKLGALLGAKTVLHGVATTDGPLTRLDVALYPVGGGDAIAKATVRGAADSIRALTDTLTRQLLAQIWRRGTPPSPLLSEVATSSGDALRAFLAGEAAFEKLQMDTAMVAYSRAIALDSTFAQAWLRLDYSRGLVLLPTDTAIRSHLLALRDRLPQRERDWLTLRFSPLPLPAFLDSSRVITARYPESYAIQYLVMDRIVHTGPRYGIPIAEALPMLERLSVLAPRNADVAMHREFVALSMADTAAALAAQRARVENESGPLREQDLMILHTMEARAAGRPVPGREIAAYANKPQVGLSSVNPDFMWYPQTFSVALDVPSASDSLSAAIEPTRFGAAYPQFFAFGRAARAVARGDVHAGLAALAPFAAQRVPGSVRISPVSSAATAAWFGLIPASEAAATIAALKPQIADLRGQAPLEISWSEGVVAIAAGDSVRLDDALRAIHDGSDTSRTARSVPRGLRALWRERRTGAVDSLMAYEEDAIRTGVMLAESIPIHRAALGRALLKAGNPAGAERYLQWPDAIANSIRLAVMNFQFGHYTSFERGQAAEARGDKKSAIRHYNDFVTMIDRPPPAMTASIKDARQRLARLSGDAPRR